MHLRSKDPQKTTKQCLLEDCSVHPGAGVIRPRLDGKEIACVWTRACLINVFFRYAIGRYLSYSPRHRDYVGRSRVVLPRTTRDVGLN